MMLFTLLNGLGVVFLLYVLVQFWKEGRRPMQPAARVKLIEFPAKDRPTVFVVTHPISLSANGGLCVVSRQSGISGLEDRQPNGSSADGAEEAPRRRYSSR